MWSNFRGGTTYSARRGVGVRVSRPYIAIQAKLRQDVVHKTEAELRQKRGKTQAKHTIAHCNILYNT
jgi:hypothetical protein